MKLFGIPSEKGSTLKQKSPFQNGLDVLEDKHQVTKAASLVKMAEYQVPLKLSANFCMAC